MSEVDVLVDFFDSTSPLSTRSSKKIEEKFYVLENSYQQLVFSNYGGALAEINLPFHSKANIESVVREIEFDRDMLKEYPIMLFFQLTPTMQ